MASKGHEAGEEEQTFLPKASSSDDVSTDFGPEIRGRGAGNSRKRGVVWWLRLVLELAMAGTIVYLLVAKPLVASRGTLRRTPVPECRCYGSFSVSILWLLTERYSSPKEDLHLPERPQICPWRHVVQ